MVPVDKDWLLSQYAGLKKVPTPRPMKAKRKVTSATERLYKSEAEAWELFKSNLEKEELSPDLEVLQLYFKWTAMTRKGKISSRPTINTLVWRVGRFSCMHAEKYGLKIPDEVQDGVVDYIKHELAEEIGLTSETYDKNFSTAVDVAEMVEYLWKEDTHCYRNEQTRINVAFITSFLADTGARIGAVTRSECYREGNVALCYKDVKAIAIRKENGGVRFRLDVTFHNMKGARLDDSKFLEQTIEDNSDQKELGSSTVLLFLVLGWLDGAFDGITSLHQLFHLDEYIPKTKNAICIPIKASSLSQPILRRISNRGSSCISDTFAWSSGSALQQQKRICTAGGWPQRFTSYNIRRGVLNTLDGSPNVSSAQRNQIAGQANSAVFTRSYLSRHTAVVVSKIFKGRATRMVDTEQDDGDEDVRGMRLLRDRDAPRELPQHLWNEVIQTDEVLQTMYDDRRRLHKTISELGTRSSNNVTELRSQLEHLTRKIYQRRQNLKSQETIKFMKQWFSTRASNILKRSHSESPLSSDHDQTCTVAKTERFSPERKAVIEALYPADPSNLSMFSAAKALVSFVKASVDPFTYVPGRIKRRKIGTEHIKSEDIEFLEWGLDSA